MVLHKGNWGLEKKLATNAIFAFAGLQAFHYVLVDKPLP